jgi:hypothetical protein
VIQEKAGKLRNAKSRAVLFKCAQQNQKESKSNFYIEFNGTRSQKEIFVCDYSVGVPPTAD